MMPHPLRSELKRFLYGQLLDAKRKRTNAYIFQGMGVVCL